MDAISHRDDFPPLTIEQIQGLVESIQDTFGGSFSRAVFTNHLLALLEDVPGYETSDIPALLIESAWAAYRDIVRSGDRS